MSNDFWGMIVGPNYLFLNFKVSWFSICRVQETVLTNLKSKNTNYEKNITFIDVDCDEIDNSDLVNSYNRSRRVSLLVLKRDEELGRVVPRSKRKKTKAFMGLASIDLQK